MCSLGSVISLWIDKIKASSPITITDGKMPCFIVSLEEAVDLIPLAFKHGDSCNILARRCLRVSSICRDDVHKFILAGYKGCGKSTFVRFFLRKMNIRN